MQRPAALTFLGEGVTAPPGPWPEELGPCPSRFLSPSFPAMFAAGGDQCPLKTLGSPRPHEGQMKGSRSVGQVSLLGCPRRG